jgi:hypothetical protein
MATFYKIQHGVYIYIGKTIQTLAKRQSMHKRRYRDWLEGTRSNCGSHVIIQMTNEWKLEEIDPLPDSLPGDEERDLQLLYAYNPGYVLTNIRINRRCGQPYQEYNNEWRRLNRARVTAQTRELREKRRALVKAQ